MMYTYVILMSFLIIIIFTGIGYKNIITIIFGICAYIILIINMFIYMYNDEPKAIDVYRGETSLEITYKNNIAIDSVVVFK